MGSRPVVGRAGAGPQLLRSPGEPVEPFPVPDRDDLVRLSVEEEDGYGTDAADPAAGAVPIRNEKGEGVLQGPQEDNPGDLFPGDSPVSGERAVDDQRPDPVPVRGVGDGVDGDGSPQGLPEDS